MSQVNLLPPELRERQVQRRTTSLVVVVGALVLVGIGFLYFLQTLSLSRAQDDLAAQEAVNQGLQQEIGALSEFANLQAELAARQELVDTVFVNEVSWSNVLIDVSRLIPSNAFLTSLNGEIVSTTSAAPPTGAASLIGNLTFSGEVRETETLATWLTRLEQVEGWVNAWFNTAQETAAFSRVYEFDTGVDLTQDVVTVRGRGGQQ